MKENDWRREVDWKEVNKFLKERKETQEWNKILYRPDQCKNYHMGICLYKAQHEPLQGQEWSTCACEGVCEEFEFRRDKKMEKNTR